MERSRLGLYNTNSHDWHSHLFFRNNYTAFHNYTKTLTPKHYGTIGTEKQENGGSDGRLDYAFDYQSQANR